MMIATPRKRPALLLLLPALLVALAGVPAWGELSAKARSFRSPEDAVNSLVGAVREANIKRLVAILGPGSRQIVTSGDPVADKAGRERFVRLYDEKHLVEGADAGTATLSIGNEDYPFPIPLVREDNGTWQFDTRAGKEEILSRRIGRNELEVMDVLRAYTEAQHEYASLGPEGRGAGAFAQKLRSAPGKKDGLYWETKDGEQESPFGPLAAKAAREGYSTSGSAKPAPFHGYLFKILKGQGEAAEGGAFDYVVNGKMVLGFAMVAYPAQYGSSGIMTFIVNQNGTVYEKDLGKNTARTAAAMKLYNPDKSWKKVDNSDSGSEKTGKDD
ncbi:DUF2950 domain-containing protein [Geobacter sp. SVR]|uniref:DUF2950 domain-containing protein n=1 Tax=Geobacter sp. SVR TaxID=2495594 RepID=UPI00143EFC09|nr:DUF2950 domain-containing protein [Geobacter sp. SVR]BCS52876.1 hypothetical protein GSVR_11840 [Geobacter sp. SVR]GCF87499.1 hypothetical protein GSbR_40990 [Geobacter sp. SVR]